MLAHVTYFIDWFCWQIGQDFKEIKESRCYKREDVIGCISIKKLIISKAILEPD